MVKRWNHSSETWITTRESPDGYYVNWEDYDGLEKVAKEVSAFAKRRDERAIALEERVALYRTVTINRGSLGSRCILCKGEWAHSYGGELHEAWCPNAP